MSATASKRPATEDPRTGLSREALERAILDNLHYVQGKLRETATACDWYAALAYTVRDRLLRRWIGTVQTLLRSDVRVVSYLSAEFLLGPHLGNNLLNLGIAEEARAAVAGLGLDLDELLAREEEPGLGNGGLGRLAACFLDSLATLEIPAIGYGIRYEFGIFDQVIRDGWQVETADKWLRLGNPWEIPRPEFTCRVQFGGRTEAYNDADGRYRTRWLPARVVRAVPYDTPILGYRVNTANLLRLWSAQAAESFDFQAFNAGDYYGAVHEKMGSESISKVLYPNDEPLQGKRLRLEQQYFFVSSALQDMLRQHRELCGCSAESFGDRFAVQLNDTHPSIAIAELMRLLIDEHGEDWDTAWKTTQKTFSYTNHTLLSEALERWPLPLFASLLPRHLEIIYEINRRFLIEVRSRYPDDEGRVARLSLIEEGGEKHVRMANLASAGSHAINGVAALHTELLKRDVLGDFFALHPERFLNVTNGVTPRRWLALANPRLTALISRRIGERWIADTEKELPKLEPLAADGEFRKEWRAVKLENKRGLAALIKERTGLAVNPESLFDVQVKRLHEYKRQHLNLLHAVTLYARLKRGAGAGMTPRTVIFGGKAAPGYFLAKLIIKLINSVADVVNADPAARGRLQVVFLPDFNVKTSQAVYPAADLSEQISTAGKEASGTGNMKFALNGALTIGTLDGANVEMREAVGAENFFLFGLKAEEVFALKGRGYDPREPYRNNPELREALDLIASGAFSGGDRALFKPFIDSLLDRDEYLVLADYPAYFECQERAAVAFRDAEAWTRMSILNVARMGRFSSDRSIREYAEKIWKVRPVKVELDEG
jgi:starch phosphorylase